MKTRRESPTVLKLPYYGFDHDAVAKQFGGGLSFVNEFCVLKEYSPVAVYRAANPDIKKGHKRYMLLQQDPLTKKGMVRGMTEEEMEKERFQEAVLCLNCNHIIYSMNRHDFHGCACKKNEVMVDGGKDYLKVSFHTQSEYVKGVLDLLTDEFKPEKAKKADTALSL